MQQNNNQKKNKFQKTIKIQNEFNKIPFKIQNIWNKITIKTPKKYQNNNTNTKK